MASNNNFETNCTQGAIDSDGSNGYGNFFLTPLGRLAGEQMSMKPTYPQLWTCYSPRIYLKELRDVLILLQIVDFQRQMSKFPPKTTSNATHWCLCFGIFSPRLVSQKCHAGIFKWGPPRKARRSVCHSGQRIPHTADKIQRLLESVPESNLHSKCHPSKLSREGDISPNLRKVSSSSALRKSASPKWSTKALGTLPKSASTAQTKLQVPSSNFSRLAQEVGERGSLPLSQHTCSHRAETMQQIDSGNHSNRVSVKHSISVGAPTLAKVSEAHHPKAEFCPARHFTAPLATGKNSF